MAQLTFDSVDALLLECLADSEESENAVVIEGIVKKFAFNAETIKKNFDSIKELLMELPDSFFIAGGGGMSFLMACKTKDGEHWGEHPSMEALFALGLASGIVKCLLPRELWSALPGGMPYYSIDTTKENYDG